MITLNYLRINVAVSRVESPEAVFRSIEIKPCKCELSFNLNFRKALTYTDLCMNLSSAATISEFYIAFSLHTREPITRSNIENCALYT
jgi:hypothetical protein